MKLFNHSKLKIEKAVKKRCPRCRGFGGTTQDRGEHCFLCKRLGEVWISDTGWTRPLYGRVGESETLY